MASEGSQTPETIMSKQERIRENQRRSRQRRQDHLADLERRLAECHSTCRNADLQRAAFLELQIENARLRELLISVGVNPSSINSYVQNAFPGEDDSRQPLRQLKPRLMDENAISFPTPPKVGYMSSSNSGCGKPVMSSTASLRPALAAPDTKPSIYSPDFLSLIPGNTASDPLDTTLFRSAFSNPPRETLLATMGQQSALRCDTFDISPSAPLLPSTEDTILCSVAKELIYQYVVDNRYMDEIRSRLATGFALPAGPGQGCRVSSRLLFDVLNDVSSRGLE